MLVQPPFPRILRRLLALVLLAATLAAMAPVVPPASAASAPTIEDERNLFGIDPAAPVAAGQTQQESPGGAAFLTSPYPGAYDGPISAWFDHDAPNHPENDTLTLYTGDERDDIPYDGHSGIDYPISTGTPVLAAADGVVVDASAGMVDCTFLDPAMGMRYGVSVEIAHPNGYKTSYAHLSSLSVITNTVVSRGQQIGLSGDSGCAYGAHLHFTVLRSGRPTDPFGWRGSSEEPCAASGTCAPSQWLWLEGGTQPGEGAPSEAIRQRFAEAYGRYGSASIAELTSRVHTWGQDNAEGTDLLVQNFREAAAWNPEGDDDTGIIVYNPALDKAFVLHGHIEDLYSSIGGPTSWLGHPTSDETVLDDPASYDFAQGSAITCFERGFIGWRSGASGFEAHTYYPRVERPRVSATLLGGDRVRLDLEVDFARAPGYPDADAPSDPAEVTLRTTIGGQTADLPLKVVSRTTARGSLEVDLGQPVQLAVEVTNFAHNTSKRGSYPPAYAADRTTLETMTAQYLLGDPPARNGQHWNRWDLLIKRAATTYNLPPAMLKAIIAHESGGLGTANGLDPSRAYTYQPASDRFLQHLLGAQWARPWVVPENPPPAGLQPCAAVKDGGYDLPAGITARAMLAAYGACTNSQDTEGLDLDFVAQYRIAARYGLAQYDYFSHYDLLAEAPPELLYHPDLALFLVADRVSWLRDVLSPQLGAGSTDIKDWNGVLELYDGSPDYPQLITAWYDGQGAAQVQPVVQVVFGPAAQARTAAIAEASPPERLAQPQPGTKLVAQLTADAAGDGRARLLTLHQTTAENGAVSAVLTIHEGATADTPARWSSPAIVRVFGIGSLRVAPIETASAPLILVDVPVGAHSLVTRVFTVTSGDLRELAPDVPASIHPGFFSDRAPVSVLSDGVLIASRRGQRQGEVVTTIYQRADSGYTRSEEVTADPDADTTAPSATLGADPAPNAQGWHRAPVQVSAAAADEGGVRSLGVRVLRDGQVVLQRSGRALAPISLAADGRYQVELAAADFAGNLTRTSLDVRLDQRAPTVRLLEPVVRQARAAADDGDGSGIASAECSRDGGATWAACGESFAVTPDLQVRLCDLADNCSAPRLQVREPDTAGWVGRRVRGSAYASLVGQQVAVEAGVRSSPHLTRVTGGESYTLTAHAEVAEGVGRVAVIWYDRALAHLETRGFDVTGASETLSSQVTAPAGAYYARVDLLAAGAGELWFDDVGLIDGSGANLVPNHDFSAGLQGWTALTRSGRRHLTTSAAQPFRSEANLALHISARPSWTSESGLLITGAEPGSHYTHQLRGEHVLPVRPGERYTLAVPLRAVNLGGSAAVRLVFRDASGRTIGTAASTPRVTGTSEWSWVTVEAAAPMGAASAQVVIDLHGTGSVWSDTVVVIGP